MRVTSGSPENGIVTDGAVSIILEIQSTSKMTIRARKMHEVCESHHCHTVNTVSSEFFFTSVLGWSLMGPGTKFKFGKNLLSQTVSQKITQVSSAETRHIRFISYLWIHLFVTMIIFFSRLRQKLSTI